MVGARWGAARATRAGILLAALSVAACGGTGGPRTVTARPAAQTTLRIGQSLGVLTEGGGEAAVTLLSVTYHRHAAGPYNPPSENGQYAVAEVSVRVMKGEYAYGPIYFQYQAGDGTTYSWGDGHGLASGYEPLLPSGILGAGESARGLVVFDVPTGPGGLIRLTGAAGVVLGQWRLNA